MKGLPTSLHVSQLPLMFFIRLLTRFVTRLATFLREARLKTLSQPVSSSSSHWKPVNKLVNVYYCQSDDSSLPLAITRYTSYDQEEKVLCVEQVVYEDDDIYFQEQITAALECGVDVSILSAHPTSRFPVLTALIEDQ